MLALLKTCMKIRKRICCTFWIPQWLNDTVWRKGILFKFYNLIRCLVIMCPFKFMLSKRLFRVHLGFKKCPFRRLNGGLPQGLVLISLLFNVHTADLSYIISSMIIYADSIALDTQHNDIGILQNQ